MSARKQDSDIGNNIKRIRMGLGLTQEQVVSKMQLHGCDISRGTFAKIEAGIRHIYVNELKALKEALDTSYEDILD